VFGALEYQKDSGHAYWGTPLVPTSFAGPNAINGVVSGTAFSTFSGNNLGPVTIDSRTLTTNYNVADNATGAQELWLRTGFEWTPLNNVTIKNQVYYWQARANWIDSETYAFDDGAVFQFDDYWHLAKDLPAGRRRHQWMPARDPGNLFGCADLAGSCVPPPAVRGGSATRLQHGVNELAEAASV